MGYVQTGTPGTRSRAGRLADGWLPEPRFIGPAYRDYPHEPWAAVVGRLRAYARRAGRDPTRIGIAPRVDGTNIGALQEAGEEWHQLGATHLSVSISPLGAPLRSAAAHVAAARRAARVLGL